MEYEEFDGINNKKEAPKEKLIRLLSNKPLLLSELRRALKNDISSTFFDSCIESYKSENIVELKVDNASGLEVIGLTKQYREKLKKQQ